MPPVKQTAYQKLTQIEQILLRPNMYIGNTALSELTDYVYENGKIVKKTIRCSDGLTRIILEVLYNAVDNYARSRKSKTPMTSIDITFDNTGRITIRNDGDVIPIEHHPTEKMYNHTLIFGHLQTSSNYDDTQDRDDISGMNGFGVKLTNIFSKEFTVEGVDPKRGLCFKQTWRNNMGIVEKEVISESKKTGYTQVSFIPDYAKFELKGLTPDIINLISRYAVDTSMLTKCDVSVNDELIDVDCLAQYAKLFSSMDETLSFKVKDCEILLMANDGFETVSFVNNLYTINGGTHLDAWVEACFRPIVEKFNKPDKPQITIKDVKNFFRIFVIATVKQPQFESQSKTCLKKPTIEAVLPKTHLATLLKWRVIDDIKDIISSKEMAGLKKTERKRGFVKVEGLDSAKFEGTKRASECTLILVEGLSAKTYVLTGLSKTGRDFVGIYCLRGKMLNTRNAKPSTIADNKVIQDLVNCLGLKYDVNYTLDENYNKLRYGSICLITDADEDGFHIAGLVLNLFDTKFKSLYDRKNFFTSMYTPIARILRPKGDLIFYDLKELENYKNQHPNDKHTVKYFKGLASHTRQGTIETYGKKIVQYFYDKEAGKNMEKAFSNKFADVRKEWISNYTVERVPVSWSGAEKELKQLTLSDFINNELIKFSRADCARSLPHVMDGFKECNRKILYVSLKTNLKTEIRVEQLSARVSEQSEYHHGGVSLDGAIKKMAQNFCGSNLIPLFTRGGGFGSRQKNGDDAGSSRYIYTKLDTCTPYIFRDEDLDVLKYRLGDENTPIEPEYYVPIIPMILVNGSSGIGTGYSTDIPTFNPLDIIKNVKLWIHNSVHSEQLQLAELTPWYDKFLGTVEKVSDKKFVMKGQIRSIGRNVYQVYEIPITTAIDDYRIFLLELMDEKKIGDFHSKSGDNNVDFIVTAINDEPLTIENMKLSTSISLTNMVAFNREGLIKKYNDVNEIINEFCTIRFDYYKARKAHLLRKWKPEIDRLAYTCKFITEVTTGNIELFAESGGIKVPKSTDELEVELKEKGFPMVKDGYSYLLDLTIRNMTKERIKQVRKELEKLNGDWNTLNNTSEQDIWIKELDELVVAYENYKK